MKIFEVLSVLCEKASLELQVLSVRFKVAHIKRNSPGTYISIEVGSGRLFMTSYPLGENAGMVNLYSPRSN